MVARLISLKLVLLRNSLHRSAWQLVGVALAALYGLGLLVAAVSGLIGLRAFPVDLAEAVLVTAGSGLVLGWALIPLVAGGLDLTLDPARFAPFPLRLRDLLVGQAAAGLIGVPGACTATALAASVVTWSRGPVPAAVAAICALLALTLCVGASRLVASAASDLASTRRFRDAAVVAGLAALMLAGPALAVSAGRLEGGGAEALRAALDVLGWTPLGAPFSAPAAAARGSLAESGAKTVIAAAAVAAVWWGWCRALSRALVAPRSSGSRARSRRRGIGPFAWMPPTPAGAVAARALVYWTRDPRYGAGLVVVPLLPVALYAVTAVGGGGDSSVLEGPFAFVGPVCAFLIAWQTASDVSYDSTAFALHLAAGVSGAADRFGRFLALALWGLPGTLLLTALPFALAGEWFLFPAVLGVSLGLFLTASGLGSVLSAMYTAAVPLPGESPFKKPPGRTAQTLLVQFGGMAVLAVLVMPELALAVLAALMGERSLAWAALGTGAGLGALLLAAGIVGGGRIMDRKGPELYASLARSR
ncbi:transporter [Sinomonas halotolerans]|uniref:Transporter n=1 Tax=Sinomonas halotolerans TaxID=1644133 RepID=A0ABU9WWR3_9MICC